MVWEVGVVLGEVCSVVRVLGFMWYIYICKLVCWVMFFLLFVGDEVVVWYVYVL